MTPKRETIETVDLSADELMFRRWSNHCASIDNSTLVFHKAIKKHGCDAFEHTVLEICDSAAAALQREIFWIAQNKSTIDECGYNMTKGGEGNVMTEASKEKHRIATSEGTRKAFQNADIKIRHAEATKRALSNPIVKSKMCHSQKIVQNKPEVKAKISAASKRAWSDPTSGFSKRKKPIQQFTLDGIVIAAFSSAREAARACNLSQGSISACARGITKHAGGFRWQYVNQAP